MRENNTEQQTFEQTPRGAVRLYCTLKIKLRISHLDEDTYLGDETESLAACISAGFPRGQRERDGRAPVSIASLLAAQLGHNYDTPVITESQLIVIDSGNPHILLTALLSKAYHCHESESANAEADTFQLDKRSLELLKKPFEEEVHSRIRAPFAVVANSFCHITSR